MSYILPAVLALGTVIGTAAPAAPVKWQIHTSNGLKIPAGWQPFGIDSFDNQDPILLRRSSAATWDGKQTWKITTAGLKLPAGWEPFGYDSNDEFDPVLLRRCTVGKWDKKQKWEIKTSRGVNIPAGWEPFGYDWNDEFDPILLRRCTDGQWDGKQTVSYTHLTLPTILRV